MSPVKTTEPIDMLSDWMIWVGLKNIIRWGSRSPKGRDNFGESSGPLRNIASHHFGVRSIN